ncbi:MAG: efflux RND transporter permease subunit, partial [Calditrichaceae bacterium]
MFLSSISIKRPIMISMILIAFFIFGLLGYFSLPLNLVPDVEFGFVTIQKKIEDAVSTISKINYVQSYSMEGVSYVIMRFELDKDPDIANQEAKDKVNAILSDLPDDAEIPIVQKFDIGAFPIVEIVMTGNMSRTELYELADKKLRDRLSQVDGVARVEISGGQEREIRVELDNRVVYQNSISLQKLSQILAVQNMNMPGGQFKQGGQEFSVRLQGEFDRVQTIKDLEIPTAYGNKKISQLAEVYDAGTEVRERTTFFNNVQKKLQDNVVLLSVIKSSEGNTVDIAKDIAAQLPDLEAELPTGTRLSIVRDASIFIESSVEDTLGNIILGIVFTGLVLLFFLHDLRSTIIVGTAMPFSIISTFLFLQISDFSLNMMTLMGLSTAVGILVANSVVVLENIFRHKDMGHKRKEASDIGTSEIAVAVIASTLTNLVVFLPIAAMTSMVGQFFKEFALTVSYATIFSLIASFTITPMLASLILPEKDTKKHPIGQKLEAMFKSWENRYKILLKKMLENKKRSLIVIVISILMFVLSLFVAGNIGFEFMPMMDEGNVNIEVELPQGYNLDQTADVVNEIQSRLEKHKEIRHIVTTLGSLSDLDKGTNMAIIKIKMVDASERDISSVEAT